MSNRYLLEDGNIIIADAEFISALHPGAVLLPAEAQQLSKRRLTKLEFFDRYSDSELIGLYAAAETEPAIRVWLDKLKMATPDADGTSVDLDDPRTVAGAYAMEFGGHIAAGRAAQVLA